MSCFHNSAGYTCFRSVDFIELQLFDVLVPEGYDGTTRQHYFLFTSAMMSYITSFNKHRNTILRDALFTARQYDMQQAKIKIIHLIFGVYRASEIGAFTFMRCNLNASSSFLKQPLSVAPISKLVQAYAQRFIFYQ